MSGRELAEVESDQDAGCRCGGQRRRWAGTMWLCTSWYQNKKRWVPEISPNRNELIERMSSEPVNKKPKERSVFSGNRDTQDEEDLGKMELMQSIAYAH